MKDASLAKRTCVVIAMTDAIPAPPAVAMRLFQATSSARTSVDEVVAILAADPAMAARVVSLCRRCNRGVSGDVDTLERTVILLGFEEIRAAAISIEICGILDADSSSDFLVGLRRHAVLTASIARVAAERIPGLGDLEPSTGFLAGLLHDLGHLVLATAIPGPLERLAESATLLDAEFNDTLLRVIGIDGSMIGERIARRWDLPGFLHAVVTSAGRGPAAIGDTEHRRLELLVGFADAIARRCSPDSIGRRPGVGTIREYEAALGLDKVDLKTLLPDAVAMATASASLLGLEEGSFTQMCVERFGEARAGCDPCEEGLGSFEYVPTAGSHETSETAWFLARVAVADARIEVETAMLESARRVDPKALMRIAFRRSDQWIGSQPEEGMELGLSEDPSDWLRGAFADLNGDSSSHRFGVPMDGLMIGLCSRSAPEPELAAAWRSIHHQIQRYEQLELICEQKVAAARREVEASQRIATLDADATLAEISAGAAHEMNNPLAVISGRAQVLYGRSGDALVDSGIEEIVMQTRVLSGIVQGLHRHATGAVITAETTTSGRLLEKCVEAARSEISDKARVIVQGDETEVGLCVDVRRIAEIAIEAVRNASDDKEDVCICMRSSIDATDCRWSLLVEDDGLGFGHAALEHAFDPFFSQKTAGRRTGLGLAVVRRIAEAHGGSASVHNRVQGGGCLVVSLPILKPGRIDSNAA